MSTYSPSLGGVDGLQIPIDRVFNSVVGSKLDGALANEFLFALKRTKFDARGLSGQKPVACIRSATYGEDNRSAQVDFHYFGCATESVFFRVGELMGGPFHQRSNDFVIEQSSQMVYVVRRVAS